MANQYITARNLATWSAVQYVRADLLKLVLNSKVTACALGLPS